VSRLQFAAKPAAPGGGALDLPPVKRAVTALLAIWVALLAAAPAALADNGIGLAGPVDDKKVTLFCFGVMAFFALLVIVLSLIQGKMNKRKEQRQADLKRYG
jgi:hypothetical protein